MITNTNRDAVFVPSRHPGRKYRDLIVIKKVNLQISKPTSLYVYVYCT